ncbi:MAG: permease-like cell division protein FtsX [Eubacteriales bacterium]|nr:permease-like cell division protein FtsX [Eubacteriales bacterium]
MSRLGYLFSEGFRGIFKHGFMSFATVAIIMACLIIMGSMTLVSLNIDALIDDLENQNEVVAFVDEELTDEAARNIGGSITGLDNITSAKFVSREEAMNTFMGNYDSALMEGVDVSVFRNRYVLQLVDIARMAETKTDLENLPGITKVNAHLDYADSFVKVRNIVTAVSFVLIGILFLVSLFIMNNTIKLATFSRKEEIGIMKMVGASNSFIRLPFIIEGLILGVTGALLAFVAQWGVYNLLCRKLAESFAEGYMNFVPFGSVSTYMLTFFVALGVLIGALGGVNAIRNYLKV